MDPRLYGKCFRSLIYISFQGKSLITGAGAAYVNAAPFFASMSIFLLNSYYNSSYNTFKRIDMREYGEELMAAANSISKKIDRSGNGPGKHHRRYKRCPKENRK